MGAPNSLALRARFRLPHLRELGLLYAGNCLFALGIVLTLRSRLGLGPWDVLHQGLSLKLPITFGQAGIVAGLIVVVLALGLREYPGIGTVLTVLNMGILIDLIIWLGFVPDLEHRHIVLRVMMDVSGIGIMGTGSALYIKASLGAGPRDSLMLALDRMSDLPLGVIRTAIELAVLLVGYALGGTVGVGTVIFALGIGPAVQLAFKLFKVPRSGGEGA